MAIYRKNFASLFSASKIHRQSYGKDDESGDDSNENSSSESESEEEDASIPRKKLKSNKESCQNLVGIGSEPKNISVNLKDPFSVLKEKKEGLLNLSEELEEKASNIDSIKANPPDLEEEKGNMNMEGNEEKNANLAKKQQNDNKSISLTISFF